ncbi:MAG TPA: ABC transporter ATP-binding protein [Anaeromyxobacteraceae bacterium]|nr:ABC transporter ATP-binding protein [Anaeromyxobacteraceae bacterium]
MSSLGVDVERRFLGALVRARAELPLDGVAVLFGPSGAGKTTVLRLVAGLERPDAGAVRFGSETWSDPARGIHLRPQERRVGFLFQDHALFPHLDVAANVGYGLYDLGRAEREARLREVAAWLHLGDLLGRMPGELSGGQRQRVALARALAPRPRLLLLDEPLSALDAPTREALRGELRGWLKESGIPAVVVTHDRVEALALGDRLVVLSEGGVHQVGPVLEVFGRPADVVVARLVGTENVLAVELLRREDGVAVVRAGPLELVAMDPGGLGREAFACVRAEEIILEEPAGAATSARNRIEATVGDRAEEGPLVRIGLDCGGVRLVALVTRPSAERFSPGRRVAALVKAPAVRLLPR